MVPGVGVEGRPATRGIAVGLGVERVEGESLRHLDPDAVLHGALVRDASK